MDIRNFFKPSGRQKKGAKPSKKGKITVVPQKSKSGRGRKRKSEVSDRPEKGKQISLSINYQWSIEASCLCRHWSFEISELRFEKLNLERTLFSIVLSVATLREAEEIMKWNRATNLAGEKVFIW